MSGVEDISDDNNEEVDEKEESSDEHQPPVDKYKTAVDNNNAETGSAPLTNNRDTTVEDAIDTEDCNKDDSSKAGNADNTLKAIAMSSCHIRPPELPSGWVPIQHASGATVYFHRESRTCSWGMPYTVKKGVTVKKHSVPVWAIPCLQEWLFKDPEADHVKRWKELEHEQKKATPLARISPELVEEYLCRRWQMKSAETIEMEKNAASSFVPPAKKRKTDSSGLPKTLSHLVNVQIPDHLRKSALRMGCKSVPKEWTVNTGTKSAVQILHEFVHICPVGMLEYKLSESRDASAPYVCTALINKISYGQAGSLTKKQAKQLAAERTLDTLLPNTFTMFKKKKASTDDYQYFAGVSIEDPSLAVMCDKAGLPLPYNILMECVQRHQGILPDTEVTFSVKNDEANKLRYHMSLGKTHQVTGLCTNKKEGKHLASQALIKELHPFVNDWGTIMNMYTNTWKHFDSKQKAIPEYESPKTKEKSNATKFAEPDQAILKKLHEEMRKLSQASSEAPTDFRERHLIMTKNTVAVPTSES